MATDDPEIVALSTLLRWAAPVSLSACARFRNPHGVARKVWQFLDRRAGKAGRPLSPIAEAVWHEFAGDRPHLATEAERVRQQFAARPEKQDAPSHGPIPATFSNAGQKDDGVAWLYIAALEGVLLDSSQIFVKVGRSNDIGRREMDLNFALPRRLGLRWRMAAAWKLPSAMLAHVAEQTILHSEAAAGRSAGREFLLIPADELGGLRRRCLRTLRGLAPRRLDARRSHSRSRARRKLMRQEG